jgi:hypothetical protein
MSETCQYCNSPLATKSSLIYHQKNNKKCIKIQESQLGEVKTDLKECEFCNKKFNNFSIKRHLLTCILKKEKGYENKIAELEKIIVILKKEYENKISELEKTALQKEKKYENKISELEKVIVKLQAENNIYEKDHQVLTNLAQQPKTNTNNNNHIINNLAVYDNKLITDRFSDALSNIKSIDLYDGQESISRLIAPCLKNEDGTQLYKCTDYSRGVYIKKDKHGNLIKDINGKNLVELIEPIATKKADELLEENNNKKDKQIKIRYLKKLIENKYSEIEEIEQHIKGYIKGSDNWKFYNNKMKAIEKDIENYKEEQDELENEMINDAEEICNDKLAEGVYDIKNMKKDSSKFSKKLSKLMN